MPIVVEGPEPTMIWRAVTLDDGRSIAVAIEGRRPPKRMEFTDPDTGKTVLVLDELKIEAWNFDKPPAGAIVATRLD